MTVAENKTRPTAAPVAGYLAAIEDPARRSDCAALSAMMSRITNEEATMWGPGIVGFGRYHYRYDSGREGDACLAGFAARKGDISVYLTAGFPGQAELLSRLGKHRMGKACLSIRRLADVDPEILAQLVAASVAEAKRRHG